MMVTQATQYGLDPGQVMNFLDVTGIAEANLNTLTTRMPQANYQNVLKMFWKDQPIDKCAWKSTNRFNPPKIQSIILFKDKG